MSRCISGGATISTNCAAAFLLRCAGPSLQSDANAAPHRGDAEGPLTERKEASSYAEDLLGVSAPRLAHGPSVQSSKE